MTQDAGDGMVQPRDAAPDQGRAARAARRPRKTTGQAVPEVKVAMMQAALDLFASRNYSAVTIKDISGAVGVNPSLIYYYFGNKEDLFLEVVNYAVEEAFKKYELSQKHGGDPVEVISNWIETHIIQFVLMQKLARISLDYATSSAGSETVDRAIRRFYEREAIVLGRAIRAGIAEGRFRPVDPRATATFISTFLDGSLFRHMMMQTFDYAAAIQSMRDIVLDHLTRG